MTERHEQRPDRKYYVVMGQHYLSDGIYSWEEVDEYCPTLEDAIDCLNDEREYNLMYVDFRIDCHIVKEVVPPSRGIESDWDR
jgi:hypothetical protein